MSFTTVVKYVLTHLCWNVRFHLTLSLLFDCLETEQLLDGVVVDRDLVVH